MFNPFKRLHISHLESFVNCGYTFATAQHYTRAFDNYPAGDKTGLLITPYKSASDAQQHLDHLSDKRHAL
jgi:hypothetical protein